MTDPEAYRRYARRGIERAAEPDSELLAFAATGCVGRSCNLVLDAAAALDDLEALVLVDQTVEIADRDLCTTARAALADPEVGAVGMAGATGATTIAWWEGSVSRGRVMHRYREYGGGEMPAFAFSNPAPAPAAADSLFGSLLVLSPWAVENVRFDESLHLGLGYDFDYCQQLRAAGRRVATADIAAVIHRPLDLIEELETWIEAHVQVARKWDGRIPGRTAVAPPWKDRARRAEAESEAARTMAYSSTSLVEAEIGPLERRLAELEASRSWRLTAPLRRINKRRRERRVSDRPAPA